MRQALRISANLRNEDTGLRPRSEPICSNYANRGRDAGRGPSTPPLRMTIVLDDNYFFDDNSCTEFTECAGCACAPCWVCARQREGNPRMRMKPSASF